MTFERILQAAVNSMVRGHHVPHCYSAHVPGQGYVNDGTRADQRAEYLRQLERSATSEAENIRWCEAYADGQGETQPKHGVLMANWNVFPRALPDILERAGYAIEWSDEWYTCDGCDKALRVQPDSYVWTPAYVETKHGELLCQECGENEDDAE